MLETLFTLQRFFKLDKLLPELISMGVVKLLTMVLTVHEQPITLLLCVNEGEGGWEGTELCGNEKTLLSVSATE